MPVATTATAVDASVCDHAITTPAERTIEAIAGRPTSAAATSPTASSRWGTANVANRAGSSVGSDPNEKSGTTVQRTMPAAPASGITTRAASSDPRNDARMTATPDTSTAK